MGFSVSGSAAIIFAAMFIAFGMFYSAGSNSMEQVTDARAAAQDDLLRQQNTAIDIAEATYNASTDSLTVLVNNTGSRQLSVNATDLIVDNAYQTTFETRAISGAQGTDLWLPGEQLRYNVSFTDRPGRVKVVAETGVAGTEVVVSG